LNEPGPDRRHARLHDAGGIVLEEHQAELLRALVEAHRNVNPREEFLAHDVMRGDPRLPISHKGLPEALMVAELDLRALERVGFIDVVERSSPGFWVFSINPRAVKYYSDVLQRQGQPAERVEQRVGRYIDSDSFKGRHPAAYAKWAKAEELLWQADAQSQLTAIGLHCREAVQEFATELIGHHRPPTFDADPTKTKNRLHAVLAARKQALGEKVTDLLSALVDYWNALVELHQRQVHGTQGRPLTREDGRRVVFQTLVVMYELDRALTAAC